MTLHDLPSLQSGHSAGRSGSHGLERLIGNPLKVGADDVRGAIEHDPHGLQLFEISHQIRPRGLSALLIQPGLGATSGSVPPRAVTKYGDLITSL